MMNKTAETVRKRNVYFFVCYFCLKGGKNRMKKTRWSMALSFSSQNPDRRE